MSDTSGGHGHGGHGHDSPMHNLWMAMTGASAGDHHEQPPGLNPTADKVGHEPDAFNARTIVYVPILVSVALLVTYLIVQGAFAFVNGRESRQDNPNDPSYNVRTARIGTTTAKPLIAEGGLLTAPAVTQPGLEYQKQVDMRRKDAYGNDVTDPAFVRSFTPTPTGNSPEIYPEHLRADRFVDPTSGKRALAEPSWADKDKKTAVIPIDDAIRLMTGDDKFKLKVADKPVTPSAGTIGKARPSTGGVASPVPADKPKAEEKKDDKH